MILARCAPSNSWVNPEVMSILTIGLQTCALEREDYSGASKFVHMMNQVSELVNKKPELKEKWLSSTEPVLSIVQNRFSRSLRVGHLIS